MKRFANQFKILDSRFWIPDSGFAIHNVRYLLDEFSISIRM